MEIIQRRIRECADKYNLSVTFSSEQVKSGGLFNSSVENCIVMYHPEHEKDYFKFCIRVNYQSDISILSVDTFGQSKQMDKAYRCDIAKQGVKDYFRAKDDYATGQAIGKAIGGALGAIGKSKKKLEEDEGYYSSISAILDEVVS